MQTHTPRIEGVGHGVTGRIESHRWAVCKEISPGKPILVMCELRIAADRSRGHWAGLIVVGIMIGLSGCSKPGSQDKFIPPPDVARKALESVLLAWQEGTEPGLLANTKPQVHITDAHRKPGQKLDKFQILGEVPGDAPRCFAVKATFSNPAAEERIRFVVVGIDPLWIFRHEDFELLSHWEHKMDPITDKQPVAGVNTTPPDAKTKPVLDDLAPSAVPKKKVGRDGTP